MATPNITITRQFCHTGRYEVRVDGTLHSRWMLESDARNMARLLVVHEPTHMVPSYDVGYGGPGLARAMARPYETARRAGGSR